MSHRSHVRRRHFRHHTGGYSYDPNALRLAYDFPPELTGKGQRIAFVELGGAHNQTDFDNYRKALGLAPKTIQAVSVLGARPVSDGPNGADGEVMLDLEIASGCAPDADLTVYYAPNSDAGFAGAIQAAVNDKVDIISISWGNPENLWQASGIDRMHVALTNAVAAGVTVLAAAGDNGSSDGETRGDHCDFPASHPSVLGCGGTALIADGATVKSETVWNNGRGQGATGGGLSALYSLPDYQKGSGIPGNMLRGVPDVAAVADPETGLKVLVDGQALVIGGTSAVAPFWAAVVACLNQGLSKRLGFLNPALYALPADSGAFRDVLVGNNGTFAARPGWDACTGLGVPSVRKLFAALGGKLQPDPVPVPPVPPTPPVPPVPVVKGQTLTLHFDSPFSSVQVVGITP